MCARTVRTQRKPNSVAKFNQTLANDILPLLRPQPGFQDEMTLFVPGGMEVVGIGLWVQQEHAEAYHRGTPIPPCGEPWRTWWRAGRRRTPMRCARDLLHKPCWRRSLTLRELWWGWGRLRLPSRLFGVLSPLPTRPPDEAKGAEHDGGRHAEYREA